MGQEQESAAAEVERLTRLRDQAERGSAEHREPQPPAHEGTTQTARHRVGEAGPTTLS
jgi:hypothetical protein